jgi:GNAT superfamily N-acetyltransferase
MRSPHQQVTEPFREPRLLDAEWIPNALLLSQEAGWNQTAADWLVFFNHGTVLGFVAGDRLVATAAVLPFGDAFGWVSMVLVTAEYRRQGLATRLVTACTASLRERVLPAMLDAVPTATGIYTSLGFIPLAGMERWEGVGEGGGVSAQAAAANLTLDLSAFGADRRFLLDDFLSRPGSIAFGSARGFAILRQGAAASHIGPIISTPAEAPALLDAGVCAATGRVFVDVLDRGTLAPLLGAYGFCRKREFVRMACGLTKLPGNPAELLAAAGPEFG